MPISPSDPLGWNQLPADAIKVLQLTDTHLLADSDQKIQHVNPRESLHRVIEQAIRRHGPFDFALATGDLAQQAEIAAYKHLTTQFNPLDCPVYCLPGNHDNPVAIHMHLQSKSVSSPKIVDHGIWRIVLLDSVLTDKSAGYLAKDELALLKGALHASRPTLIALHHQPVPVGNASMDAMALGNAEDLFNILDQAPQARALIWGHVHQAFEQTRNHLRLMACPSTCIQFRPDPSNKLRPGYRLLGLLPDGEIYTEVVWL